MTTPEHRRGTRYEVQLPCRVSLTGSIFREFSALTVNMSRSGVLLALQQAAPQMPLPQIGQAARIVLELPHLTSERRCVECHGRVVRVPVGGDGPRLAFEFRRYQFI